MTNGPSPDALRVGVAVIDLRGRFTWVNPFGTGLLGANEGSELLAVQSPFDISAAVAGDVVDQELSTYWDDGGEYYRLLIYRFGEATDQGFSVTFRDITEQRQQQGRIAALARTAANVASQRSVASVLDAMAQEVQHSEGVAGTQFITVAGPGRTLRVMGSAGFAEVQTFFDLLLASHRRGAVLATFEVMDAGRQIVYAGRREQMLAKPEWQPLHAYISQLDWEDFVCTPLVIRDEAVGVLNVYMEPNFHAGASTLDFFTRMAEQASLALDYATLLERDRIAVRREERKRLARELHDSVVQQVFSIGMHARALQRLGTRVPSPWGAKISTAAGEIGELSGAVQRDLRGIVIALQPSISAEVGLDAALELVAEKIARLSEIRIDLLVASDFPQSDADFVEDVYQIVSESIHNAVKHASPSSVGVAVRYDSLPRSVTIDVVDDGRGPGDLKSVTGGYGLSSMRERVARWSGHLEVMPNRDGPGTHVHASLVAPAHSSDS